MNQMSARILTQLERIILNGLNKTVGLFKDELAPINYVVLPVDIHIVDRIDDRDLCPYDVNYVFAYLAQKLVCQFLFECNKNTKSFLKFTIQYGEKFYLHGTCSKKETVNLVRFRTLVNYRMPYDHGDFLIIIPEQHVNNSSK